MSRHDSSIQYNFHCHQELFASRLEEINVTNGRKLVDDIAGSIDLKITYMLLFFILFYRNQFLTLWATAVSFDYLATPYIQLVHVLCVFVTTDFLCCWRCRPPISCRCCVYYYTIRHHQLIDARACLHHKSLPVWYIYIYIFIFSWWLIFISIFCWQWDLSPAAHDSIFARFHRATIASSVFVNKGKTWWKNISRTRFTEGASSSSQ